MAVASVITNPAPCAGAHPVAEHHVPHTASAEAFNDMIQCVQGWLTGWLGLEGAPASVSATPPPRPNLEHNATMPASKARSVVDVGRRGALLKLTAGGSVQGWAGGGPRARAAERGRGRGTEVGWDSMRFCAQLHLTAVPTAPGQGKRAHTRAEGRRGAQGAGERRRTKRRAPAKAKQLPNVHAKRQHTRCGYTHR